MVLQELMQQFSTIEGAFIGQGSYHSSYPNQALLGEIDDFLQRFPFLRDDQGYIDFLSLYAGAGISQEPTLMVDICGFTTEGIHIVKDDGEPLDKQGFFTFCLTYLDNEREIDFSFDATGHRERGVYRAIADSRGTGDYAWFCPSFLIWLERLIQHQGRLDE